MEKLYKAFEYGCDYGQLLMEEERESEATFNGFAGALTSRKLCMPLQDQPRRQIHSEKWFAEKRKSKVKFFELLNER